MSTLLTLKQSVKKKGAGFIVLIDPDKKNDENIIGLVENANLNGADAIFVGGSIMMDSFYNDRIKKIKSISNIPVILFPGGVNQISKYFDAILFMSLLSGRNPHYLIGEQVLAAPIVKDIGIETIPTAYLLIDGGSPTSVEYISGTKPLPSSKPDLLVSHALAAQFLGMKMIYLECGSGAKNRIPNETLQAVSSEIDIDVVVGGGVRTVEDINKLLNCGADKVSINTAAVENSKVVVDSSKKFGSQCIVVAIDAKKNGDKWEVFTHGGRNNSGIDALEYAEQMEKKGAGELLVTSMDRDGTQVGYDIDLMSKISSKVNIPVIASGGVGNLDHLVDGIKLGKASAVLAASIFHYGKYSVKEAKDYLDSKGIPVRI